MPIGRAMGFLHPALVHFPLVLLLLAVGLEAIGFFRKDDRLEWSARLLLLLGAVSTLFAFVCGNFAEIWAARAGVSQEAMENHELLATVTSWTFVLLTGWRLLMRPEASRPIRGLWLAVAAAACVLLGVTGHRGAMLVYERGAAVQGMPLAAPPSHEDLGVLLQRQDAASIFYSNMMHHVFGWMVLILALVLLLDYLSPAWGEKARRFGPYLLLAGGVFLLIFSDQDAWPLYHVRPFRPIYDKEVLLHKTYAVLMLVIGSLGAWRAVCGKGVDRSAARGQDRVMAVFSLVGGALLFTHVHSAAPYANVAVGVYIHHTTMGFVALCIGAVKLMDDALGQVSRWRLLAYPALMGLEALLLVNYNEGLPWFLGYRHYQTAPAHGGLVAPLGPYRAEVVYDPASTRLSVYTMAQDGAARRDLPVRDAQAIVRQGEEATAVPLRRDGVTPGLWTGTASFLRGATTFQVQAAFDGAAGRYTADFEPWIDRAITARSTAPYICPMHSGEGAQAPGACPLCGMPFVPNRPARPAGVLHDDRYRMDLTTAPGTPEPGWPTRLRLLLCQADTGAKVTGLSVVHTKLMHLIVVSSDLSFFDHVHPVRQPDGAFLLDYTFPHGGDFLLYADVTPKGELNQVFRLPVPVAGGAPAPGPIEESLAPARAFGPYRVRMDLSPNPPLPRDEAAVVFTVERDGKPVTDLEPVLGASGHCVILSQDTRDFLHSHPMDTLRDPNHGPRVTFHTRFPRRGLYKVWVQFRHDGRPLIADFVVRVP